MKMTRLRGWSVTVRKDHIPGEDDVWVLVFTETFPPTGDEITYEMNRDTRDAVVKGLTDGIILAGGDLPRV